MGAYIYRIDPPSKSRDIHVGDSIYPAVALRYCYKPWSDVLLNEKIEREHVNPTRRAWRGKRTPPFVVVCDNDKGTDYEDGAQVRTWPKRRVTTRDEPDFAGRRVGTLLKRGGQWIVRPDEGAEPIIRKALARYIPDAARTG